VIASSTAFLYIFFLLYSSQRMHHSTSQQLVLSRCIHIEPVSADT